MTEQEFQELKAYAAAMVRHGLADNLRARITAGELIYNHWLDEVYSKVTFYNLEGEAAVIVSRWLKSGEVTVGAGYQLMFAEVAP